MPWNSMLKSYKRKYVSFFVENQLMKKYNYMFRLQIRNTSKEETWRQKKRKIIGKGTKGFTMTA